jgi:hypothetical protein
MQQLSPARHYENGIAYKSTAFSNWSLETKQNFHKMSIQQADEVGVLMSHPKP